MKNERGFALTVLLALLPVLLALLAALVTGLGFVQTRSRARNQCRRTLLAGLESAGSDLKTLVDLNGEADALRAKISETQAEIAAVSASGGIIAAGMLRAELNALKAQQRILDLRQKALLFTATTSLATAQARVFADLMGGSNAIVKIAPKKFKLVRPAVHKVGGGPAPDYELDEPFPRKQRLAQSWHSEFQLPGPLGQFLRSSGRSEEECAATLEASGDTWRARLAEDKF